MRIDALPDVTDEGQSRGNEGMTGYEPKRVRANYMVTICNQFNKGLVASLLLTMIVVLSILRDMQESITISSCESTIPHFVRSDHSCVKNLEQRYSLLNKCLSPNVLTRFCSDGHCPDYDQRLCPNLRRFYDEWYKVPTGVDVPTKLDLGPNNTSKIQIRSDPSFFSLGRKELVQDLRSATTESNPNLPNLDQFLKSFFLSLMISTNSQFDSLAKFHRVESTSLPITLCQVIVALSHDLCLRVFYLFRVTNTFPSLSFLDRTLSIMAAQSSSCCCRTFVLLLLLMLP